jgi:hypothetical protein
MVLAEEGFMNWLRSRCVWGALAARGHHPLIEIVHYPGLEDEMAMWICAKVKVFTNAI